MRCVWSQKVRDGGVGKVRQEAVVAAVVAAVAVVVDHQAAEVPVQDQAVLQGLIQYNRNFIYNHIMEILYIMAFYT